MVAGELPSRSIVAVGDGDKFSCQWSVDIASDNASGLGDGFRTVELVVGSENAGAIGIGFLQFHSRGLVIEPGGSVPVGVAGRISGDVPFVHPEGGQGHHMIGLIVGEACGLDGRAVFGYLSSLDVVGIASSTSHGIGDGSHSIAAGKVAGGGYVAGCIRGFDWSSV